MKKLLQCMYPTMHRRLIGINDEVYIGHFLNLDEIKLCPVWIREQNINSLLESK